MVWNSYVYGKRPKGLRRTRLRHRIGLVLLLLVLVAGISAAIVYDLHRSNKTSPVTSKVQTKDFEGNLQTFRSTYFQFQDSGKWVLSTNESTPDKVVYYKYHGLLVQYQLIVYINQVPIPLYLAVARTLPVRIVNHNSFDVTTVSEPCGKTYAKSELHKVKTVSINQAMMLCDPDTPSYSVVLSQIDGNYQLPMTRLSGAPVQFVITYRDLTLDPRPDTLLRVANSFQAL
jgi:hypothetical protein